MGFNWRVRLMRWYQRYVLALKLKCGGAPSEHHRHRSGFLEKRIVFRSLRH